MFCSIIATGWRVKTWERKEAPVALKMWLSHSLADGLRAPGINRWTRWSSDPFRHSREGQCPI
jgi:hypothetical protein